MRQLTRADASAGASRLCGHWSSRYGWPVAFAIDHPGLGQDILEKLVAWSREHLDWPTEAIFSRVMRATLADATRTCSAAALLTRQGYGPESLKLGRSLLEATIVAHWMIHCAESEWVLTRMREHQEFNNVLWLERFDRHDWPVPVYSQEIIDWISVDRDRLSKLYGNHGELSWWVAEVAQRESGTWKRDQTRNLEMLVEDLYGVPELEGKVWERAAADDSAEPKLTSALGTMLAIPQRVNNQFMHHNPSGLVSFVDMTEGEFVFDDGPSEDWISPAQYFLYACYSLLVVLLIRTYRPELEDEFDRIFDPLFHLAFVTLTDKQLAWASDHRNEPCPCGSGVKSKKCHLAVV